MLRMRGTCSKYSSRHTLPIPTGTYNCLHLIADVLDYYKYLLIHHSLRNKDDGQ